MMSHVTLFTANAIARAGRALHKAKFLMLTLALTLPSFALAQTPDPVTDIDLATKVGDGATSLIGILGVLVTIGIGFMIIGIVGRKLMSWFGKG